MSGEIDENVIHIFLGYLRARSRLYVPIIFFCKT